MDRDKTLLTIQTAVPLEFAGYKSGQNYQWLIAEDKTLEFLCSLPIFDELDALAVTVGPGRFTSTRVGVAFALGLAYSRRLPIFPINVFDVVYTGQDGWYLILSRRGEYYANYRRSGREVTRTVLSTVPRNTIRVVDSKNPLTPVELERHLKRAEGSWVSWRELKVKYMREVTEEYKLWK